MLYFSFRLRQGDDGRQVGRVHRAVAVQVGGIAAEAVGGVADDVARGQADVGRVDGAVAVDVALDGIAAALAIDVGGREVCFRVCSYSSFVLMMMAVMRLLLCKVSQKQHFGEIYSANADICSANRRYLDCLMMYFW